MLRGLFRKIGQLLSGRKVDEELLGDLEEALILSDVSVATTEKLLYQIREAARKGECADEAGVRSFLQESIVEVLGREASPLRLTPQGVSAWLVTGVNGTGKTTTIAKLARWVKQQGKTPVLAAADTFRAAAIEQLQLWGERVGCRVVAHKAGADPAAVAFDAIQAAAAKGADVVIVDTAGRLHTKMNLMEELSKVCRVIQREQRRQLDESLLVLDATTGQNGLNQVRAFAAAVPLSGILLTKLDGTAKGGIVLTIRDELGVPIKAVGTGEKLEDFELFDPVKFAEALFE